MKKSIYIICCFFFLIVTNAWGQFANNWYFGSGAGLSFSSTPPSTLSGGQTVGPDNSTTISDASGNLLFYTDGVTVWNKNNVAMTNGTGLVGSSTAGQCALIVPIPCDPNKYVIFQVTDFANPGYLSYSVVDMTLGNGLGDVVSTQKNVSLGTGWTEKLCAYYNPIGNNYWVLTHKWNSADFVAFSVTSSAIATQSVVSSIGSTHTCGAVSAVHDAMGQLTISPDGTKVLNALTCQDKFELFNFNSQTGVVSNSIAIAGTGGNAWGTAFSPNSQMIYVNTIFGNTVFQYDISSQNQNTIAASQYSVVTVSTTGYNFGYMELGPDNKLYVAKPGSNFLSVVNNPNASGSSCNFSLSGQSLGSKVSSHGTSRIAYNIPLNGGGGGLTVTATPGATLSCINQSIVLTANGGSSTYTWTGPGFGPVVAQTVSVNSPGNYTCTGVGCSSSNASTTFSIYPAASLSVTSTSTLLCAGVSATLSAIGGGTLYTWQPGNLIGQTVTVSPSVTTTYSVASTNSINCNLNAIITVSVLSVPLLTASPSQTVCQGINATFTAQGPPGTNIYWLPFNYTTSSTNFTLSNLNPGLTSFTILGVAPNGCSTTVNRSVLVNTNPTLTISPSSQTVCFGSNALFTAFGAANYTWYPAGQTGSNLAVTAPMGNVTYTVNGVSVQGCTATAFANLSVTPLPTITTLANPTVVCAGGTVSLTSFGASNYTWQPGGMTGSFVTVSPLATTMYTVYGEANSCVASQTLVVSNPVDPVIISSGNISCTQSLVTLTASSSSTLNSIVWSGPGVNGSSSSNIIVTAPGIYSVQITDVIGNCYGIATVQVLNTIAPIQLTIVPSSTVTCFPGSPVNMLINNPSTFTWYPSSEVTPPNGPLVSVSPSVTTTYTVEATQGVCSGSAQITISVNITPTINLLSVQDTICAGREATLSAQGGSSYIWSPGALNGSTVNVSPLSTTVYTVMGYNYNCYSIKEITVTVLPSPQLTVSAYPLFLCVGNASTLTASGANQLSWLIGDPPVPGGTAVVMPFGNTTYTAVGTNSLGCSSTATISLIAISSSTLSAQSSESLICSGTSVTLNVSGSDNYTWTPSNLTGSQIVQTPATSTTYTVYTNSNGCGSFTTVSIVVNECGNRTFGVTNAASKPALYRGSFYRINFTVTVVNNSSTDLVNVELKDDLRQTFPQPCSYTLIEQVDLKPATSKLSLSSLYDGDFQKNLTTASGSTLTANSRDTLLFSLLLDPKGFSGTLYNTAIGYALRHDGIQVSDSSNNGFLWDPDNDGDPTNNDTLTPIEIPLIDLFIPEGFTPDGDGINDFFVIKGLSGRHAKLEIYNRWGNRVYSKDNYDNTWDGYANVNAVRIGNGKLPDGTYYYFLQFSDKQKEVYTGFVVLKY